MDCEGFTMTDNTAYRARQREILERHILDTFPQIKYINTELDAFKEAAKELDNLFLGVAEQAKDYADEQCGYEDLTSTGAQYMDDSIRKVIQGNGEVESK